MMISKRNVALLEAYKRGYRVLPDGTLMNPKMKEVNPYNKDGYLQFSVRINGIPTRVTVHRLQAYQKYGDQLFSDGIETRHLNNVSTDNSLDNIAIGNHTENLLDRPKEDRLRYAINAASKLRRWTDAQVQQIIEDHNNGMSYNKLIEKYQTSKGTLSYLFNKAHYHKRDIEVVA